MGLPAMMALLLSTPVWASLGVIDDVPAATLLVPYFEADYGTAGGRTTIVSVRNTSQVATLAHVTLWSDLGVPVYGFDLYLTGYDAVTFDMHDVLTGALPATASAGQDPADTISHKGTHSQDINYASCGSLLPPAALSGATLTGVQNALTGKASSLLSGNCGGQNLGDPVARGYLTIDTTSACTTKLPTDTGYFVNGGTGFATNNNVLTGHFSIVNPALHQTRTLTSVHLEANTTGSYTSGAGTYTFYSRVGSGGADNREAMGNEWGVSYQKNITTLLVWRDEHAAVGGFACGVLPAAFPMDQKAWAVFDTEENASDLATEHPFPATANLVPVDGVGVPVSADAGWMFFNGSGPSATPVRQSFLAAFDSWEQAGLVSGYRGTPFDSVMLTTQDPAFTYSDVYWADKPRIGAMDPLPAATLLLPYFEVDLNDPNQASTSFTVTNTTPSAVLARITLWTDLGLPTRSFEVYFTGYDTATVDLRLLLQKGVLTPTASAGQDVGDVFSHKGTHSQDINYASCTGHLGLEPLPPDDLAALQKAHTGQASALFAGSCGATNSSGVARGYVTIDAVNQCNSGIPSATSGDNNSTWSGAFTSQNVITGQYTFIHRAQRLVYSDSLVHIQASFSGHPETASGQYTFYGRWVGWTGADLREPLPTAWELPYDNTGDGKTSVFLWRDPGQVSSPFTCGQAPGAQPGDTGDLVAYDEEENPTVLSNTAFQQTAARIATSDAAVGLAGKRGFLMLDLNPTAATGGPSDNPGLRQSFASVVHTDTVAKNGWAQAGRPLDSGTRSNLIYATEPTGFVTKTGGTTSFFVRLGTAPQGDVTVPLSINSVATLSTTSVVLNISNWQTGVEVTVTGLSTGSLFTTVVVTLGAATATDSRFSGFNPADVNIMFNSF